MKNLTGAQGAFIARIIIEAMQSAKAAGKRLMEAGFTGQKKDKLGHTRYYQDGRQVKNPNAQEKANINAAAAKPLPAGQAPSHSDAATKVNALHKDTPPEHVAAVANDLMNMSVEDLTKLAKAPAEAPKATLKKDPRDKIYEKLIKKGKQLNYARGEDRALFEIDRKHITPEIRKLLMSDSDREKGWDGRPEETESFELKDKSDVTGDPYDHGMILIDKRHHTLAVKQRHLDALHAAEKTADSAAAEKKAKADADVENSIMHFLKNNPDATATELRRAAGHKEYDENDWMSNPVHAALSRLEKSGKIKKGTGGNPLYSKADETPTAAADKPGFTGTDSQGREWRNGALVAAKDEPADTPTAAAGMTPDALALDALRLKSNKKPHNAAHLTPDAIASLKQQGFINDANKLTDEGRAHLYLQKGKTVRKATGPAKPQAAAAPAPATKLGADADALEALRLKSNKKQHVAGHITPDAVASLKKQGFIDENNKLTPEGRAHLAAQKFTNAPKATGAAAGAPGAPKPKWKRAARNKDSLISIVKRKGGINSASVKAGYDYQADIIEGGLLHAIRKQGMGLDEMAQTLQVEGHIIVPEGVDPGEHLLNEMKARHHSALRNVDKEIDLEQEAYYKAKQQAEQGGHDERSIENSRTSGVQAGESAGEKEGATELDEWDNSGAGETGSSQDATVTGDGYDSADADDYDRNASGPVDTSFDFGANVQAPKAEEPKTDEPTPPPATATPAPDDAVARHMQRQAFTGIDSQGREWRNGELVAAKDEPTNAPAGNTDLFGNPVKATAPKGPETMPGLFGEQVPIAPDAPAAAAGEPLPGSDNPLDRPGAGRGKDDTQDMFGLFGPGTKNKIGQVNNGPDANPVTEPSTPAAPDAAMDEETYLATNGASRQDFGEPALHRQPRAKPDQIEKNANRQLEKDYELSARRDQLRKEYADKVASGEIRPLTRTEKLIQNANGHEDNESTQAARRILKKSGIDWNQQAPFADTRPSGSNTPPPPANPGEANSAPAAEKPKNISSAEMVKSILKSFNVSSKSKDEKELEKLENQRVALNKQGANSRSSIVSKQRKRIDLDERIQRLRAQIQSSKKVTTEATMPTDQHAAKIKLVQAIIARRGIKPPQPKAAPAKKIPEASDDADPRVKRIRELMDAYC